MTTPGETRWTQARLPWPDDGTADAWLFATGAPACAGQRGLDWLDEAEQRRAGRFVSASARASFLAGRYALRVLLARYLRAAPAALRFESNAWGKPRLVQAGWSERLHFNLSHAVNGLLIGVARCELGVDLQAAVRERTLDGLKHYLSPAEAAVLSGLATPAARAALLLGCWSRKEAVSKAIGMGLHLDPKRYSVPTGASCAGVPIVVEGHGPWWLSSLDVGTAAHAAVASAAPLARIRLRTVARFPPRP